MEAKELRIGNIISDYGGRIVIVRSIENPLQISDYFIGVNENNSQYLHDDINPIPLTEEWLLKLGFDHKSGNEYVKDRFVFRKNQKDLVINGFEYDYNGILISANNMRVHQLQNLYFALTGNELEIK